MHLIRYTATLLVPDGSDTDMYGEPCEPGHGVTEESGWLDPDWSLTTVYDEPTEATPDTYDSDEDELEPSEWLAQRLRARLGSAYGNGDGTWYAEDGVTDHVTGTVTLLAAHAENFTAQELRAAEAYA